MSGTAMGPHANITLAPAMGSRPGPITRPWMTIALIAAANTFSALVALYCVSKTFEPSSAELGSLASSFLVRHRELINTREGLRYGKKDSSEIGEERIESKKAN